MISACRVNSIYSYPRIGSHDHTIQFNNECFFYLTQFSFTAEENQTVTKTVIDAVLADHGGDKCPWSAAELRGTLTATHGFIIAALV